MRPTFYISKQNLLYWTEEQLHKQPLDDSTLLNGHLNRWTITGNCDQYVSVLSNSTLCVAETGNYQCMFLTRWQHSAQSKTDTQTNIMRNVSKTLHFRSWMTLAFQHITWPATSHNLTMPDFFLQCFLKSKLLTNHPQTLKSLTN